MKNFLRLIKTSNEEMKLPKDFDQKFEPIFLKASPYTMTSPERMHALYKAVQYIINNKVDGDIVECGVWRGGSSMVSTLTLLDLDQTDRYIYMYDTYKGMTEPTKEDRPDTYEKWKKSNKSSFNSWCYASLDEVKENMNSTGYPKDNIIFVEGDVEKTIPKTMPEKIAILRLDTDWYKSTYHELNHLYPRLVSGGVLIIDDYGHHEGARKAVDQFFAENNLNPYLARIDATCRIVIKA